MAKQPKMLGLDEVAKMLRTKDGRPWKKEQVLTYMKRGVFPEPAQRVAATPLWTWEQIEKYKQEREDVVLQRGSDDSTRQDRTGQVVQK
jgi:hypothetical protein